MYEFDVGGERCVLERGRRNMGVGSQQYTRDCRTTLSRTFLCRTTIRTSHGIVSTTEMSRACLCTHY